MEYLDFYPNSSILDVTELQTIYKMDPTTFMMKIFATNVGAQILSQRAAFKSVRNQNEWLLFDLLWDLNFSCTIFMPVFFCFFKIWLISSPSWNSSMVFLRLTYPQIVIFMLREASGEETLESFWQYMPSSIYLVCPKQNISLFSYH